MYPFLLNFYNVPACKHISMHVHAASRSQARSKCNCWTSLLSCKQCYQSKWHFAAFTTCWEEQFSHSERPELGSFLPWAPSVFSGEKPALSRGDSAFVNHIPFLSAYGQELQLSQITTVWHLKLGGTSCSFCLLTSLFMVANFQRSSYRSVHYMALI